MSRVSAGSTSVATATIGPRVHRVRPRHDRDTQAAPDESPDPPALVGFESDPRLEPRGVARSDEQLAQASALAVADELLLRELGHPDRVREDSWWPGGTMTTSSSSSSR